MKNKIIINHKISKFNKKINVSGDKSLSIRWILFASLASGRSKAYNLLMSEDVIAAIDGVKKLGAKVRIKPKFCEIIGVGHKGYKYRDNLVLDAKNSGTFGRLILGLLIDSPKKIKLIGDKSLSKRDFERIAIPLRKFGAKIELPKHKGLPLYITGSKKINSIEYLENRGSAQCKSSIIFAGLKSKGETLIKAKKSRNHTELLCKYLKLPLKLKSKKKYDLIKIKKIKKIKNFNYKIPSDISSSAFFIVLTVLSKNSSLLIKNININPSRTGIISILQMMGAKIHYRNKKIYKGELVADIYIKSSKTLSSINCPTKFNSGAIDEFLVIFLVAAKAKGVSTFSNLSEMNKKESPRLKWGAKILNSMGIKTILTNDKIKIYGNPNLSLSKKIVIKNFLKDHRVFMTSVIAGLVFGGSWHIHDKDSINTSFPSFLKIIDELKK